MLYVDFYELQLLQYRPQMYIILFELIGEHVYIECKILQYLNTLAFMICKSDYELFIFM